MGRRATPSNDIMKLNHVNLTVRDAVETGSFLQK